MDLQGAPLSPTAQSPRWVGPVLLYFAAYRRILILQCMYQSSSSGWQIDLTQGYGRDTPQNRVRVVQPVQGHLNYCRIELYSQAVILGKEVNLPGVQCIDQGARIGTPTRRTAGSFVVSHGNRYAMVS